MSRLWLDLRYSVRSFLRTPASTLALVLTIALGIGSNVAVQGFVHGFAGPTHLTPEVAEGVARVGALLRFAAATVYFIACANVALFLLGRASTRSQETSLRVALGVSRGQLARQLLSDSVVISIAGGASGMLLAVWTSHILPALLFEPDAEQLVYAPDRFGILAASAICIGIMIACGLLPAFAVPYDRPASVLRRESAGQSKGIRRVRTSLIVAQMATCYVLVISTAFLLESLHSALETDVARRLGHPILATAQADPHLGIAYFREVERAVHSVAGISGIAWAGRPPGAQPTRQSFLIEPPRLPQREVALDIDWFRAASLDLFTLPPVAGRMFDFSDRSCRAAIVNQAAAKELFGAGTVGRILQDSAGLPVQIIGVVAMRTAANGSRPTLYYNGTDLKGSAPRLIQLAHFRTAVVSALSAAELDTNVVSPDYFQTVGAALVAGKDFQQATPPACRIAVVNEEAAARYFPKNATRSAVIDAAGRRTEIIGMVHTPPLGVFQRRVEPAIYFPMDQDCLPTMTLLLAASESSAPMLAGLRRTMESVPGRGPGPLTVKTLETHLRQTSLAPLRIATVILGASATIALLLSALGLFGALSDAAVERRRELAIRISLGARPWQVVYQVLREGAQLACAGTLIGIPASLLLTRSLERITLTAAAPALWVWFCAPLALAAAVALASVLPARRALLLTPLTIMRDDH